MDRWRRGGVVLTWWGLWGLIVRGRRVQEGVLLEVVRNRQKAKDVALDRWFEIIFIFI
jgi:hypothetical protein